MISSAPAFDHTEPDGSRLVVMTDVDSVNFYQGSKQISSFALTSRGAMQLAWFLLWTYWIKWLRFGWRTRRASRAMTKQLRAQAKAVQ